MHSEEVHESDDPVQSFWGWFTNHARSFSELEGCDGALAEELDSRLKALRVLEWEIGPAIRDGNLNFLVLSPAGDLNNLPQIEALIRQAPRVPGWEFYACKPPKGWDRQFEWSRKRIPVDARNWWFNRVLCTALRTNVSVF